MEQGFGAQLLTLPHIFEGRYFTVPDYQRGYAWDEKQVEELLRDIDHLMNDGVAYRHYTGTLVLSQPDGVVESEFHVVDGQQRLTTLVIFLRMLADHLAGDERDAFQAMYLRRGDIGSDRPVLRLNADTRMFFERVVMGDGNSANEPATLEAHERLLKTRKLIQAWLDERTRTSCTAQDIRNTVEKELGFLVYSPREDAETGIMFEVINNRGKQLSELEKVKNYLIYCCVKLNASTLRSTIDTDWSSILRDLNTAKKTNPTDEGAFLRYCVTVHFKLNKTDSQYGYDELKKRMAIDAVVKDSDLKRKVIEQIEDFVKFMRSAALWYARLYGQQHSGLKSDLVGVLNLIRAQERHASIMPIFLALVIKWEGYGERLVSLLRLLEILNFRVYMARNMTARNDTGQGGLYYFGSRYYHGELLKDLSEEQRDLGRAVIQDEEDALEYYLVQFVFWNAPDTLYKESFRLQADSPDDFYKWGGLRYFLMNYEQELQPNKTINIDKITLSRSEGKSADYLSIEHLWARENRNREGENNRKIDGFERRRIGNLVLLELRLNIQGGNDGIEEKLPRYVKGYESEPPTDLEQVRKMVRAAKEVLRNLESRTRSKNYYLDLHRELNELQEGRYIAFAEKRWSIKSYPCYKKLEREAQADLAAAGDA